MPPGLIGLTESSSILTIGLFVHKSFKVQPTFQFLVAFFVLSHCFLDFSVGVGAFVIRLSQISSFFFHNRLSC